MQLKIKNSEKVCLLDEDAIAYNRLAVKHQGEFAVLNEVQI